MYVIYTSTKNVFIKYSVACFLTVSTPERQRPSWARIFSGTDIFYNLQFRGKQQTMVQTRSRIIEAILSVDEHSSDGRKGGNGNQSL